MRKLLWIMIISVVLSGCSFLTEVNQSLEYANEATEYVTNLNEFASEAPQLIQEAASDPEAKEELEDRVNALKQEIEQFNEIEPPAIAQDIHEQIVNKNEQILVQIKDVMENGELIVERLESSAIVSTIQELKELSTQLEQFGE